MLDPVVADALATLLEYPDGAYAAKAARARAALEALAPDVAQASVPFFSHLAATPGFEQEELFTRTFDWAPERALELGWHLYGEQYERGAFLVKTRDLLRAHGVEEGRDLPDHVGTLLRLVGRMPPESAGRFVQQFMRPALVKLRAGFGADPHPYLALLAAIEGALPDEPVPVQGGAP